MYSEPAEVQRQLSHYRSMPLANTLALSAPEVPKLPDDKLFNCEFCDFSSEHQSSVRRHYGNIHGKKLLRCKDCGFFTGIRWAAAYSSVHNVMSLSTLPSFKWSSSSWEERPWFYSLSANYDTVMGRVWCESIVRIHVIFMCSTSLGIETKVLNNFHQI